MVWRWFADPAARDAYPAGEHAHYSRVHVADLRANVGRRAGDPVATRLVQRLRGAGEEFAALWELHEVAVRRHSRMRVLHPVIGPVASTARCSWPRRATSGSSCSPRRPARTWPTAWLCSRPPGRSGWSGDSARRAVEAAGRGTSVE
ncbi:hypothetical protein [Streptomyces sp. NPDC023838]|uniref:MmyB family transcriptional regulator n=1 Tax=Streptomyces sp. NPDC023838 TaxID=3154325 RepID=UPI0033D33EB4